MKNGRNLKKIEEKCGKIGRFFGHYLEVSDIFCTFAASKRTSLDNVIINRATAHNNINQPRLRPHKNNKLKNNKLKNKIIMENKKNSIKIQAAPMQVTRRKVYKKGTCSLARIGLEELYQLLLSGGEHAEQVRELRHSLAHWRGLGIDRTWNMTVERITPAALIRQSGGNWLLMSYAGIIMLKVDNVFTTEEKTAIRRAAASLPMTLMAFEGASGMSMYVLVRVGAMKNKVGTTVEEAEEFHQTAFRQVSALYNALLPKCVNPKVGSRLTDDFMLSIDPKCFFRKEAEPFLVTPDLQLPERPQDEHDAALEELLLPVPTMSQYREYYDERWAMAWERAEQKFREEGRDRATEEDRGFMLALVEACFELHIPLPEARARMLTKLLVQGQDVEACVNGYYERHDPSAMPKSQAPQDVVGLQRWLLKNYEFQRNAITKGCLYRPRTTSGDWQVVGPAEQSTITLEAMKVGLRVNRGNVRDFFASNLVPLRDPVVDYLKHAEEVGWDGQDRIEALASCVPTGYAAWPRLWHVWFCAFVHQMQGGDGLHGNALMPLLIGEQGAGKSNFCRALLPPELRWGWLEKVDFSDQKKVMRLMATSLLINLDEFNQTSRNLQQGSLKNLLQLPDVRVSTGGVFEIRPRRASFIGTCNPAEVLADDTGSRRYICVKLRQKQDIEIPVDLDYVQLYAQAVYELRDRAEHPEDYKEDDPRGRTFLTRQEEQELQEYNRGFERPHECAELFDSMFMPLTEKKDYTVHNGTVEMTRQEILTHIEKTARTHFPDYEKQAFYRHIGDLVDSGQLLRYHTRKGSTYHLRPLKSMI
jgi:hypothetical protein